VTLTPARETTTPGAARPTYDLAASLAAIAGADDVEQVLLGTVDAARALTGAAVATVHIPGVGGAGAMRAEIPADALRLAIKAGPHGGELLVARAAGELDGDDLAALISVATVAGSVLHQRLTARDRGDVVLRELAAARQQSVEIQEAAGIGVWELDLATGALEVSEHLLGLLDLDPGLFGATLDNLVERVHPDDRAALGAAGRGAIDQGGARLDHRVVRRDGTEVVIHTEARAVVDDGHVVGLRGTARDVTEQHEMASQLRQAQRAETIGSMATGLAHDFNNLLTVIHGHTSLLLNAAAPGAASRSHLEAIELASTRAAQLTAQLLAYAKRDAAKQHDVSVGSALVTITKMLEHTLDERIRIDLELLDDSWVRIDPGQLDQVIVNLVVNARDAMPNGGVIRLRTTRVTLRNEAGALDVPPGDYCVVEVHDQGIGMDRDTLERIFDPFFTTKTTGTGLGLATVHRIVRQSGGAIRYSSAVGQGTTARLFLPAVGVAVAAPPASAPSADPASPHVLVVDDDDSVRSLVLLLLTDAGFQVTGVESAAAALEALAAHRIDLVLADLSLGAESGLDLTAAVRLGHPALPVVLMSGYAEHEAATADATFLAKPFSAGDLVHAVRSALA
jgi:signal transduction histidine kinase/CheY-like chemotaxis protein